MLIVVHYCYRFLCTVVTVFCALNLPFSVHSSFLFTSVPAHVEMMGFLGIGNNPMVGCTVACAVDVAQALNK